MRVDPLLQIRYLLLIILPKFSVGFSENVFEYTTTTVRDFQFVTPTWFQLFCHFYIRIAKTAGS